MVKQATLLWFLTCCGVSSQAQHIATIPGQFEAFGSPCNATLSATDVIRSGRHDLSFHVRGGPSNTQAIFALGVNPLALPLPGGPCELLVDPILFLSTTTNLAGEATLSLGAPASLEGQLLHQALLLRFARGTIEATNGLRGAFAGRLTITSVSTSSAAEGDWITILGSGFDPLARNNCVLLAPGGGAGTFARVLSATPTRLIARVRAVPGTAIGPLMVMRGQTSALPTGTQTLMGLPIEVVRARWMNGIAQVEARTAVSVGPTSPRTSGGVQLRSSVGIRAASPSQPAGTNFEFHFTLCDPTLPPPECGEFHATMRSPLGLTATQVMGVLAEYLNRHVPRVLATTSGSAMSLRLAGGTASSGSASLSQ